MIGKRVEPHARVFLAILCKMGKVFLASVVAIPACLAYVGSNHLPLVTGLLEGGAGDGHTLLHAVPPLSPPAGETVLDATLLPCPWIWSPQQMV